MLNPVFDQFAKKSPITVMARGMMERVLNPQQLDEWFARIADQQYTRDLLFSSVFAFCVALVSYIIVSVMKSALGSVHGADVVENQISGYYISDKAIT